MFTVDGIVTMPLGLAVSVTVSPAAGAAELRVMVPFIVFVSPSVDESGVSVMVALLTLTVVVPDVKPAAAAVTVVVPALTGVTVTFTVVLPWPTVALMGTETIPVGLVVRLTVWPPAPAGEGNVTVSVPVPFIAMFSGLGLKAIT